MERELTVLCVHGEGDRETVNALQAHRNNVEIERLRSVNAQVPDKLLVSPDEVPDVLVVLRDAGNPNFRMELPLENWNEVELWKGIAGWDSALRHWKSGATVKVNLGG